MQSVREILFLDPAVADPGTMLGALRPGVAAIRVDDRRPAARQIAAALAGRRELAAIHLVAHGGPGRVDFSAGPWTADRPAAVEDWRRSAARWRPPAR